MKPGFWSYIRAAFNARPAGMFIPPNWGMVGLFGLLGVYEPGFLLIGAGLELAYLFALSSNRRFQNLVNGRYLSEENRRKQAKFFEQVRLLIPPDRERFEALVARGQQILAQQRTLIDDKTTLLAQAQGLARLQAIYLRLLLARQAILKVIRDAQTADRDRRGLQERLVRLQEQLKDDSINPELRRSLTSQMDILQQRLVKQTEARDRLAFVEAELTRVQEQVELIREQAGLTTDPTLVSQKIDEISATLGGTNQWISEQQRIFGAVEDLLEPPTVIMPPAMEDQKQ
jgi:hypothetical protein